MNGENINDEYSIKIDDLEKQLKELKEEKENEDEFLEDKQFNEEINQLKENQQKEILSLQKEINQLKKNNNTFINPSIEINEDFLKIIQDRIIKDILEKLDSYFNSYDRNIKEKILQMKAKINKEYGEIIIKEINQMKLEIEKHNEKIIENYIEKQNEMINNLKKIELELNFGIEKIDFEDSNIKIDESQKVSNDNIKMSNNKIIIEDEEKDNPRNKNKYNKRIIKQTINRKPGNQNNNENKKEIINIKSNLLNELGQDKSESEIYENEINNPSNQNINQSLNQEPLDSKKKILIKKNDPYFNKFLNSKVTNILNKDNNDNNEDYMNVEDEIPDDSNAKINIPNNSLLNRQKQNKFITNLNSNSLKYNNMHKNKKNQNMPISLGSLLDYNKEKNKANKIIGNEKLLKQLEPQKDDKLIKKPKRYYLLIKEIFFLDNNQEYFNKIKINEFTKEEIINEWKAHKKEVEFYFKTFIETRILPKIQMGNLDNHTLDIIKYNISAILECIGMEKNYYLARYYEMNRPKKNIDRMKSQEAMMKFRNTFGIGRDVISDIGLEQRLLKNDLNIEKTLEDIYG